jgi:RecG-like helicase
VSNDKKRFRTLTKSPDDIRAEHLRDWSSTVPGTVPISQLEPKQRARVAGVIQKIRIDPREGRDSIEATIIDGTGRMKVKWLGRQTMSGISLGMGLVVEGTVAGTKDDLTVLNPEYRLVPGAEHG